MTVGTDDKTISTETGTLTLGEKHRDNVTGFEGIATSYAIFIEEPNQILLENDNASRWFTEGRVLPAQQTGGATG